MRAYCLLLTLLSVILVRGAGATPDGTVLVGYVQPSGERQVWLAGYREKGRGWSAPQSAPTGRLVPSRWRLFSKPDAIEKAVSSHSELMADEFGNVWYPSSGTLPGGLATTVVGNIRPRTARRESTSSRRLSQWTRELLQRHHLRKAGPAHVVDAWRVDLDGNGVDEIIWAARSRDEWSMPYPDRDVAGHSLPSDYALLALAYRRGGSMVLRALEVAAPNSAAPRHRILGAFDLDHDSRMEIYAYAHYFEDHGLLAFTFDGRSARGILGSIVPGASGH